jgi:hypothetical protein
MRGATMSSKTPWEEVKEAWIGKEVVFKGNCPYCGAASAFYRQAIASLRLTFRDSWSELIGPALFPKKLAWFGLKRTREYAAHPKAQTAICPNCDRRVSKCPQCAHINAANEWTVMCASCTTMLANV